MEFSGDEKEHQVMFSKNFKILTLTLYLHTQNYLLFFK